ncbi:MAG: glycosyltransferase family 4 protein, partial [Planctomycetes bacterium]|nr:glycosyltransferase family 4 protein [Planctomycetota bacterium]
MNVCLLCRQYPPADGGGIGTYMSRYARALARQGCCVTVVTAATGRHPGSTPVATDASGITIVEIPVPIDERWTAPTADATDAHCAAFHVLSPASLFGMAVARCLPALHDRHGFDIVESPETGAALWFALNERRTSRAWPASPVFVTHVFSPSAWIEEQNRCPATSRGELALRWMEADAARWSDARVCSSRALADWAERAWDLAPGDIDLFPPPMGEASESPTTPAAGRRLLYVGRLEPRKGVDVLLASFARAGSRIDDLHLELAGHDMTDPRTNQPFGRRSVELHVPASLRRRVHLLGHLDHRVLAQARRRARAAVIPAACDNYPYACIEAMAAGLPVIAARAGGVASLVRHGREGLLFDPGDIDACADAIVELVRMDAPRRSEMGKAAADRVRSVCDDRAVANARLDHYARLIDRRPSAPARSDIPVVVLNAPATHQRELEPLVAA